MERHRSYFNIDHFQIHRSDGDVSLLLSNAELHLHPKVLVQFKDGPAIALIRQRTSDNKFLILAGRTKTASALRDTDVEIDRQTVEQAQVHLMNQHLPDEQVHVQHEFCCVLKCHQDHELFRQHQQEEENKKEIKRQDNAESSSDEEEQNIDEFSGTPSQDEQHNLKEEHSVTEYERAKIEKTIVTKGIENTKPKQGDLAICHYISKKMDQTNLDNTYERKQPYSFILGRTKTTVGFAEAVSSMNEGETSSFLIPWQKLYGEQGLPGNLPQRLNLTFIISLLKVQSPNTQNENENVVATLTEETMVENEDESENNPPIHLVTYTKITIEIVRKYSSAKIEEINPELDQEEASKKQETLGEEHCPERAHEYNTTSDVEKEEGAGEVADGRHNHEAPKTEDSLQTDDTDNKDIAEGIEVLEDKEPHTSNTCNVRKALQTVASVLWPRSTKGHFLDQAKIKTQNP